MKFKSGLALVAEEMGPSMRIIVKEGRVELACRKERKSKLRDFISNHEETLFKGRLQIRKVRHGFSVLVKGKEIGKLDREAFVKMCRIPE